MVPSSSTSITLLFGDSLMSALLAKRNFTKERFKIYHPGGSIGKTLLLTKDIMLKGNKVPLIQSNNNIDKLNNNLILSYTGINRTAHKIANNYVKKLTKEKKMHVQRSAF